MQNGTAVIKVKISAIDWVKSTPSIPKSHGKTKISGMKYTPCLQEAKKVAPFTKPKD